MSQKNVLTFVLLCLFFIVSGVVAWEKTEVFTADGEELFVVGDHGDEGDHTFSYIKNTCVSGGLGFICSARINGEHFYMHNQTVVCPSVELVYILWTEQTDDLWHYSGALEVINGGYFEAESNVKIHIEYPY